MESLYTPSVLVRLPFEVPPTSKNDENMSLFSSNIYDMQGEPFPHFSCGKSQFISDLAMESRKE